MAINKLASLNASYKNVTCGTHKIGLGSPFYV